MTTAAALPEPAALRARVEELFRSWRVPDSDVEVLWNRRLSTTAGRAFVRAGRIELNPRLLATATDRIDAVLVHEAAHVAAHRLFGEHIPAHGRQWRSLVRLAGHEPAVTHDIPVDGLRRRSRRRRYVYLRMCGACGDRVVTTAVRYGRCPGCSQRDHYLVLRAPATRAGRAALAGMSSAEVRARCG